MQPVQSPQPEASSKIPWTPEEREWIYMDHMDFVLAMNDMDDDEFETLPPRIRQRGERFRDYQF